MELTYDELLTLSAALASHLVDLNREIASNGRSELKEDRERARVLFQRVVAEQRAAGQEKKSER